MLNMSDASQKTSRTNIFKEIFMSKTLWKGSALLAPVPAALVTC